MIKVNNDIGKDFECDILYKGEKIGTCKTTLSFYDILCQIKQEQKEGYSMMVKVEQPNGDIKKYKCEIGKNGQIHPASMKGFKLWNSIIEDQLLFLHGFKNEIIYSESVPIGVFS